MIEFGELGPVAADARLTGGAIGTTELIGVVDHHHRTGARAECNSPKLT